ncbi:MAG TPA: glycosyltransferase [Gemmataceae bacterium]|nr:glycosyltransferase [Gemmataceae bacterium]
MLAQVKQRTGTPGGPERVQLIANAENKGYPAGCNRGLAEAKGQYLVYLNNDTVVTAGWLEGLIRWSLYDWPKVGMVGPVTNHAVAPQAVQVDYGDLAGLPAFAVRWRTAHANQAQRLERLVGFCLLVRREVHNAIGGFDEQFGLGFFDDDDFSLRARQRGFDLIMANDVFIHHFGNRAFAGMGVGQGPVWADRDRGHRLD